MINVAFSVGFRTTTKSCKSARPFVRPGVHSVLLRCMPHQSTGMAVDFTPLLKLSSDYPVPAGFQPSYGTAGFRGVAALLSSTVLRCGALVAVRSLHCKAPCGLMITASHNPEPDNGVKLIDSDGEMLSASWEPKATAAARAASSVELVQILASLLEGLNSSTQPVVLLGYDTRPSSPELAELAKAGALAMGARVVEYGLVTTPQLHFMVRQNHLNLPATEAAYFEQLQTAFLLLNSDVQHTKSKVMVDCANGIGALKLANVAAFALPVGLELQLINTGDDKLNDKAGADFVQKDQALPRGFASIPADCRCCSIDGDADRMVYFHQSHGRFHLLDGDKIATLAAIFVHDLLAELPADVVSGVKVGMVQTAYANGASTKFLREHLGLTTVCTPTGVKHLHAAAKQFDIAIYFEANGHGTILFSAGCLANIAQVAGNRAAAELLALSRMVNQAVGDALSNILLVETILRRKGWGIQEWIDLYHDLPSRQLKVSVADRSVITTTHAETQCRTPDGLQAAIDRAVATVPQGRAFVRPSGTEDVVRVYAEAAEQPAADALAREVAGLVHQLAGGTGSAP